MPGMCMAPQPSSLQATISIPGCFTLWSKKPGVHLFSGLVFPGRGLDLPWTCQGLFPSLLATGGFLREPERRKSGLCPLAVVPFLSISSPKRLFLWVWCDFFLQDRPSKDPFAFLPCIPAESLRHCGWKWFSRELSQLPFNQSHPHRHRNPTPLTWGMEGAFSLWQDFCKWCNRQ